jgi:ABC-type branched-subunit amino acid transport system substrate-binding protein
VKDYPIGTNADSADSVWQLVLKEETGAVIVLWLAAPDVQTFWERAGTSEGAQRIYVSTTLYGSDAAGVPRIARSRVYFVRTYELPGKLPRLLARSTGWLRAKRIYAPEEKQVQADAYFAMKMAGGALANIRGFFNRDYFLESIEHMVDNASYTSVYPHVSLAPNQRFVSKGCYIAQLSEDGSGEPVAVSGWLIPGSK